MEYNPLMEKEWCQNFYRDKDDSHSLQVNP